MITIPKTSSTSSVFNARSLKTELSISIVLLVLDSVLSDNSLIDPDHLREYPYCGSMYYPSVHATGRVANAKDGNKHYRWVMVLVRSTLMKSNTYDSGFCSGSVITDR